jgi:hypothetical protein
VAETITFTAAVAKVSTLADGGIRVTLDLDESSVMAMAQLVECKRAGAVLSIKASPILINKENSSATKGRKQQSEWQAPEGQGADRDT